MNTDDIVGALYSPSDGHIDPAGYCTALASGAKMNGAQVKNLLTKLLCLIKNNCNGCEINHCPPRRKNWHKLQRFKT